MPRRSNDFQRLVLLLQHNLAAPGVLITESDMVSSLSGLSPREVDITIRLRHGHDDFVIAIEATNLSRPATVPWVESMIAKHANLATDKLILYSGSGFVSEAAARANLANVNLIESRDLDSPAGASRLFQSVTDGGSLHIIYSTVWWSNPSYVGVYEDGAVREALVPDLTTPIVDSGGKQLSKTILEHVYFNLTGIYHSSIVGHAPDLSEGEDVNEHIVSLTFPAPVTTLDDGLGARDPYIVRPRRDSSLALVRLVSLSMRLKIETRRHKSNLAFKDLGGQAVGYTKFTINGEEFLAAIGGRTGNDPLSTVSVASEDGSVRRFVGSGAEPDTPKGDEHRPETPPTD